jgi:hypothetical protein
MLKELIKQLAAEQVESKKLRKTGPYSLERNSWGDVDYGKVPERVRASWRAAGTVRYNKACITAALNLYHEVRGSDYRHELPEDDFEYRRDYDSFMNELREKL